MQFLKKHKFSKNAKNQKSNHPYSATSISSTHSTTKNQRPSTPPSSSSSTTHAKAATDKSSALWNSVFSSPTSSTSSVAPTPTRLLSEQLQSRLQIPHIFSGSLFVWIQLLFPHIISFVSYANLTASITPTQPTSSAGAGKGDGAESEEEGEEEFIHRLLGLLSDMFVGGLKCLITLTNHSYSVADEFLSSPTLEQNQTTSPAPVFDTIISMIYYTIHARNDIQANSNQNNNGNLSSTSVLTLQENISEVGMEFCIPTFS